MEPLCGSVSLCFSAPGKFRERPVGNLKSRCGACDFTRKELSLLDRGMQPLAFWHQDVKISVLELLGNLLSTVMSIVSVPGGGVTVYPSLVGEIGNWRKSSFCLHSNTLSPADRTSRRRLKVKLLLLYTERFWHSSP